MRDVQKVKLPRYCHDLEEDQSFVFSFVFVGEKTKGFMSLILNLVFLFNFEMFKGKYCLDSWLPRSGNKAKIDP